MAWALENLENLEALVSYEAMLNDEAFKDLKCIMLCQYDMRLFSSHILNSQIDNHPLCHIGKELYRNHFYVPPQVKASEDRYSLIFNQKLHQIKESKNREQTVASLYRQTEELKEFSHMLVHDLKGPINTACILTTMLEEEFSASTLERAITSLKKASERLDGIEHINKVTYPYSFVSALDVNKFLRELISEYQDQFKEIGGSIILHEIAPITLAINKTHLLQVFCNIINNALKYRSPKHKLCISISVTLTEDGQAKVTIEDNGIGFSAAIKDKIFQPFFRASNKNLNIEGSGIGLTICQKIMQKYDGRISARSEEGKGATFELNFPANPETLNF